MVDGTLPREFDRVIGALTRTRTGSGCAVIDHRGRIIAVNRDLAELLHTREEDLTDTPVWALDMEMTAEQFNFFRDQLQHGEVITRETVIERRNISQFPAQVLTVRFSLRNAEFLLWCVSDEDPSTELNQTRLRHLVSLFPRVSGQGPLIFQN